MAYTSIDDPSAYFQVATYTGAGANQTVTNDGNSDLQPDWLWIKRRNAGYAHALFDSNRGLGSSNPPMLESNSTAAENSNQNWISGVGTDSFTIGINEQNLSNTAGTYVAWQWKVNGGTTSSNTDGDLTSTVQVNQTAGISIFTYTGKDPIEPLDIGHGLGSVPDVFIIKRRNGGSRNWGVYHKDMNATPQNGYIRLNESAGYVAASSWWRNEAPTSTIIKTGEQADVNQPNDTFVGYAFKGIQGYSKFGKYVGNASANGTFVYTGFKPAWVMIKGADVTDDWYIFDHKRLDHNPEVFRLRANTTSAETTGTDNTVDLLSNGFKLRFTGGSINGSGSTYIYMAFAENPFVTSTGIPTTAR